MTLEIPPSTPRRAVNSNATPISSDPASPSAQLQSELRVAILRALATRRPLLHHLNSDTSWLLQIPRPASAIKHGSRIYYNLLIDPWFVGGQKDVASWFSQQWHREESAVKSIEEIEQLVQRVEELAGGARRMKREREGRSPGGTPVVNRRRSRNSEVVEIEERWIDAVVVSHEFTDHCHKETLLEVHKDVPVFATDKAAALISNWSHFRSVNPIPLFTSDQCDWRDHSVSPLPTWLSISRLIDPDDPLSYHSALLIAFATIPFYPSTPISTPLRKKIPRRSNMSFSSSSSNSVSSQSPTGTPSLASSPSDAAECVIYTPHGIPYTALTPVVEAMPRLEVLAFLHGLHDVRLSAYGMTSRLNLGAENGVRSQMILQARYWVGTHDEVKKGGGLIWWFLKRSRGTVEQAIETIRREFGGNGVAAKRKRELEDEIDEIDEEEVWKNVRCEEVGNGESRVLK